MIRIYAFLSLGAALVVSATELIRVIIHFVFKVCFLLYLDTTIFLRSVW